MDKLILSPYTMMAMPYRARYLSPVLSFIYKSDGKDGWGIDYDHSTDLLSISMPFDIGGFVAISRVAENIQNFIEESWVMSVLNRLNITDEKPITIVKEILAHVYAIAKESLNRDDVYYYLCKYAELKPTHNPVSMDWDHRLRESLDQMYLMLNRLPHGVEIRKQGRAGVMIATINDNYRCLLFTEAGHPYPQLYIVDLATREPLILRISQQGFIRSKRIRRMNEIKRQLIDAVVGMADIERINTILSKTVATDFR